MKSVEIREKFDGLVKGTIQEIENGLLPVGITKVEFTDSCVIDSSYDSDSGEFYLEILIGLDLINKTVNTDVQDAISIEDLELDTLIWMLQQIEQGLYEDYSE